MHQNYIRISHKQGTTLVGANQTCSQPWDGHSQKNRPRLPLTSLFELLLVVVQGLVVVHADPVHLDSQLLRHRLLAAGRRPRGARQVPCPSCWSPPGITPCTTPRPSCPGVLLASFPEGKTEAGEGHSLWGPGHVGGAGGHTRCAGGRHSAAWPSAPWWPGCVGQCGHPLTAQSSAWPLLPRLR